MDKFESAFSDVSDPRAGNARHGLLEVIFIALAATLCGAQSCVDMSLFAKSKEGFLREILEMRHGAPSHDTFSRVFRLLDPEAFEAAFMAFATAFSGKVEGIVAIDGKALRGAYARGTKSCPLHMVNVWAVEARFVVAQRLAPNRNEVAGMLDVLALLDLENCIVTADALHCREDVAAAIITRKGQYALAIKGNRPKLLAEAKGLLSDKADDIVISEVEEGHDRCEIRKASVARAPALEENYGFKGARAVASVEAVRQSADGAETISIRYYLLSTYLPAARLAEVVRAHWSIENNLHWMLDVAFHEDAARNRTGHGAQNLSLVRKLALNIIRADNDKGSIKGKIKRAGWDQQFLNKLLAHMR